ncbi:MAG: Hsp70 family protein [Spirochaetales bacterium]|nr:Hsp70 family protein [Spirochaetales bacterium]
MSDAQDSSDIYIGLRLADGSFFPVIEEGFTGRKKLIVTTVRDDQESVQIDLYKGKGKEIFSDLYIGTLLIENITPAPKGEVEIEVYAGIDESGNLFASAEDKKSGERQTLSVSMTSLREQNAYDMPDFDIGNNSPVTVVEETIQELEPEKSRKEKKKGNLIGLLLFIIGGLILIAGITIGVYFLIQYLQAQQIFTAPSATPAPTETPKPVQSKEEKPTPAPAQDTAASSNGTWYTVVKGDTLWDIARQFYRDPFLWEKIHKHPENHIPDPDLIFVKQRIFVPEK